MRNSVDSYRDMWRYLLLALAFFQCTRLSLAESESCDDGVLKVGKICVGQCLTNTTCRCTAITGSSIEHCEEYCLAVKCPDIYCKGGKTCRQYCGQGVCGMQCLANEESCVQNCTAPGQCEVLMCSAKSCTQSCANCTMVCTAEVESCKQYCTGGSCNTTCNARSCRCGEASDCDASTTKPPSTDKSRCLTNSLLSLFMRLLVAVLLSLVL
ncbi:keratin-associated protein 4-2 [Nematostella vectensis]|uniref:keratin-associated protein 4-2 n=1 Tax=Nematostella vectensis TaxID=45351 RepID=UPI00138F9D8A|nr:keratin-associated protein 4-2 [Nematostella vectensis]